MGRSVTGRRVNANSARVAELGVVVAAFALAAAILALAPDDTLVAAVVTVATGLVAAWIAWWDLRTFTIPDGATLTIAVLACAARWSTTGEPAGGTALTLALDGALPGGALLLFREVHYRRHGVDGLGFGDVKLAAAGGLLVGAVGFSWALFAASALALAVVAGARLLDRSPSRRSSPGKSSPGKLDKVAFGAALAPTLWVVWTAQQMPLLLSLANR